MKLKKSETVKKSWTKIDKKGREETWEWEETPEVRKALEVLHAHKGQTEEQRVPTGMGQKTREN